MGFNLVVFAWAKGFETHAARKRQRVTFDDVYDAVCQNGTHPALRRFVTGTFLGEVKEKIGPPGPERGYLLERYPRALVFDIPFSGVPKLVERIGRLARKHGLTSVGA